MASIFAKKGILYLKYYAALNNGKKKSVQISLKIKDTRENRKLAKIVKAEKEAELLKPNKSFLKYNISLASAFKIFINSKTSIAKSTKTSYNLMYKHLIVVINANKLVQNITKDDIQNFEIYLREEVELAQNSISSYFRHLKAFWNWLIQEKFYNEQIVHTIKAKEKPIEVIPDEDFDKILEYFKSQNIQQYRIIKFLQLTGLRIGEATELNWEWVNFDRKRIVLQNLKGKRTEEFPLYPTLFEFLYEFRKPHGKIFNYKNVESLKFWYRAMKKLGFNYKRHSIRKTFATKLVEKDIPIFDAMKLLRHKNVTTTIKYYTAVNLDRIGNKVEEVFDEDLKNSKSKAKNLTKDNFRIYKINNKKW